MSLSVHERPTFMQAAEPHELTIGQEVTILQTLHEKPDLAGTLGTFVASISEVSGILTDVPHTTDDGREINYYHVDQGTGKPTYVVPRHHLDTTEGWGKNAEEREIHFTISLGSAAVEAETEIAA